MEPKLVPKSMENRFQDALNKKDEKWSEKSHARVCRGARVCAGQGGWGPLNQFIQSPQGTSLGILSLHFVPKGHGGGYKNAETVMKNNESCISLEACVKLHPDGEGP